MLKKVLLLISEGCSGVDELAEKLDMQKSAVEGVLHTLTKKGYLREEYGECKRDLSMCSSCVVAKQTPNLGVTRCITEKGMRYLG